MIKIFIKERINFGVSDKMLSTAQGVALIRHFLKKTISGGS